MAGRRSNGEGSVLHDKRRKKPFRARVTIGWEYDETTGKSKQITKDLGSYKTKGEANAALASYLKNPYDLNNKDITFSQLYKIWIEDNAQEHESMYYRFKAAYKYCVPIYNKKVRDLSIIDMKNCIYKSTVIGTKGKNKGQECIASPSTKESIKYMFNHIFDYALEARIIDRNYAREFRLDKSVNRERQKLYKNKTPFSQEELQTLWRSIEFVPFADMILFGCYSGWRPTEILKIRIENVDLTSDVIKGGIKTEAGKNRIVPIHPLIKPIVEKYYKEALSVGSPYLFNDITHKKNHGLSYDRYLTRFNNVLVTLKFRLDITPHYTRHTFISKAKRAGMNEYILKLLVGHAIGDITEHVYTHRELEELKEELLKIRE